MAMVALSEDKDCRLSRLMDPTGEKKAGIRPRSPVDGMVSAYAGQFPGVKSPVHSPVSHPLPHPRQQHSWVLLPAIFCASVADTVAFRRIL